MRRTDLYSNSVIINYEEGDQSLERIRIEHTEDINDKYYTVRQGDSITSIAHKFYGEPLYWFIIADANNLINPMDINEGDGLLIPNRDIYELS